MHETIFSTTKKKWITKVLKNRPQIIDDIEKLVQSKIELFDLPVRGSFLANRPEAVMERMVALDLLKTILISSPNNEPREQALQVLVQLAERNQKSWSPSEDPQYRAKRQVYESERYEALEILAQWSPVEAFDAFRDLDHLPAAIEWFRQALVGGLINGGLSRDEASTLISKVRPNKKL